MYAVIERDRDGKEKVVKRTRYFIAAHDFAESLNEDMEDNGCSYSVRECN
jgi:hypothetical protein